MAFTKEHVVKFFGVFFVVLAIFNIVFFAFGKISNIQFWFIIIVCAIMAYWGVPFMRKSLLG